MGGRIYRPEGSGMLALPEIGKIKIGEKRVSPKTGKEYPASVDYFIPSGKYAELFRQALGDKPSTIPVIFYDDNPEAVCNERYELRDTKGALVAFGDGKNFRIWNGRQYAPFGIQEHPDLMERAAAKSGTEWKASLELHFIIPAVQNVVGAWKFTTRGAASSIKNIRDSFDSVQMMRGTVTTTVFDLSVQFAKSNKPDDSSKYPVVSLVANDTRVAEIQKMLSQKENLSLLLPNSEN